MTGRELIIYILENDLENEPVFQDDKLIGFLNEREAAVKLNVGIENNSYDDRTECVRRYIYRKHVLYSG